MSCSALLKLCLPLQFDTTCALIIDQIGTIYISNELFTCRLPLQGGAVSCLVIRGRDAITRWHAVQGPDDPVVARVTDPHSLRAQLGGASRTENVLTCSHSAQAAMRELAYLFGGRLGVDAFPKKNQAFFEGYVPLVAPATMERAWIVLHPSLSTTAVARVLAAAGDAGLKLVQVSCRPKAQPHSGCAFFLQLRKLPCFQPGTLGFALLLEYVMVVTTFVEISCKIAKKAQRV